MVEADGELTFTGPAIAGGFSEQADPVNRAVVLAMALVGTIWPWAFPQLLSKVQWRWRRVTVAALRGQHGEL